MNYYPSTSAIIGSTLVLILIQLPIYIPAVMVARRLIKGRW